MEIMPTITLLIASERPSPPSDLKYCNLVNQDVLKGDDRNYPVLVWGVYTYWMSLCTVTLLPSGDRNIGTESPCLSVESHRQSIWYDYSCLRRPRARCGTVGETGCSIRRSIKLSRDKAEFIGQGGLGTTFSSEDLRIS